MLGCVIFLGCVYYLFLRLPMALKSMVSSIKNPIFAKFEKSKDATQMQKQYFNTGLSFNQNNNGLNNIGANQNNENNNNLFVMRDALISSPNCVIPKMNG